MRFIISQELFEQIKDYCLEALQRRPRKAFGLIFGTRSGEGWIARKVVMEGLRDISRDPQVWPFFVEIFEKHGWPQCSCPREDMGFMIDPKDVWKAKNDAAKESLELIAVFHLHPCNDRMDQSAGIPSRVDLELHPDQTGSVLCVIVHANSQGFQSFRAFKILQLEGSLSYEEVEVWVK